LAWKKKYGRKDLEADLAELDVMRARLNRLLLKKKLSGFEYSKKRDELDALQKSFEMKLINTILTLGDEAHARKNQVVVMQGHDGKAMRKSAGKWVPATKAELEGLMAAGQQLKIVRPKGAKDIRPEAKEDSKWQSVSRAEGRRLSQAGECVKFGEGDSAQVLKG
jgi:hypothetical protein